MVNNLFHGKNDLVRGNKTNLKLVLKGRLNWCLMVNICTMKLLTMFLFVYIQHLLIFRLTQVRPLPVLIENEAC